MRSLRRAAAVGAIAAAAIGGLVASQIGAAAAPGVSGARSAKAAEKSAWTDSIGNKVEFSSPAFGMDGKTPIIAVGSYSGYVYVVNAATGQEMPGWPRPAIMFKGDQPSAIESSPAIANLDGPNKPPSIIVGVGSLSVPNQNGGLIAWHMDGKVRFVFHTLKRVQPGATQYDSEVFATPAVGPLQGPGSMDIVFGSYDRFMYALTKNGYLLHGFPVNRADTIWSSAALVDPNGSGHDDIIMGGDATGGRFYHCIGGWIVNYGYDNKTREPVINWQHCMGQSIWSSPAIGYLSNTSKQLALVVGASWNHVYETNPATKELFAYYVKSGKRVPGWPVKTVGASFGSPAIVHLLPGRPPVVVTTDCAGCGEAVAQEWTGGGKPLWTSILSDKYEVLGSPVVANVDGGYIQNVLVGITTGLQVIEGDSPKVIETIDSACRMANSPAVFQLPQPTKKFPSGWGVALACTFRGAHLTTYPIPAPKNPPQWPQWRGNAAKTGYIP